MDKKISDLNIVQKIESNYTSILVNGNTDYQYSFETLVNFVDSHINKGTTVTTGDTLPQNNYGENGDIFLNTQTGSVAKKISAIWTVVYTLPSTLNGDGTVVYGLGTPAAATGKNGDTYVNTGTGTFFKKNNGAWSAVFSMLNGPPGIKGEKGDKGEAGNNGKTMLNGISNPSNQSLGNDGDFYLNTNTMVLFGPKTNGVWLAGTSLQAHESMTIPSNDSRVNYDVENLKVVLSWDMEMQGMFPGKDAPVIRFQKKLAVNSFQERPDLYPVFNDNGSNIVTTEFEGITPDLANFKLIISR